MIVFILLFYFLKSIDSKEKKNIPIFLFLKLILPFEKHKIDRLSCFLFWSKIINRCFLVSSLLILRWKGVGGILGMIVDWIKNHYMDKFWFWMENCDS